MTDYKQLCAKVLAYYEGQGEYDFSNLGAIARDNAAFDAWEEIRNELKSALSEPEPEGPTEQEWDTLVESAWDKYMTVGYQGERFIYERDFDTALGFVREELACWGNNTSRSI